MREGALWIGTRNAGVARVDPVSGKAKSFAVPAEAADAQNRNSIIALKADPARGIWVVTVAGIELLEPATGRRRDIVRFATIRRVDDLIGNLVFSADGSLWAATPVGLWRVAPGGETAQQVAAGSIAAARSIVFARGGSVYAGTPDGLMRIDVAKGEAARVWPAEGDRATISHNVFDVVEDAEGKIWAAAFGSGLAVYEPTTGHVELLSDERNVPGSLPEKFERRLFLDHSGLLWVGGINSGFATTDPLGAKFHLIIDSNPNLKNPGNYVSALDEDAQGRLWLALAGADLTRYNRAEGTFTGLRRHAARGARRRHAGDRPASRRVAQCGQRHMVGRDGQGRRAVRPARTQRQAPRDPFAAAGLDRPGARHTQGARRQPVARLAGRRACAWPPGKRRVGAVQASRGAGRQPHRRLHRQPLRRPQRPHLDRHDGRPHDLRRTDTQIPHVPP